MAKANSSTAVTDDSPVPSASPKTEVAAKLSPTTTVVEEAPQPMVTFDRWFAARGFRPQWKAGMKVYADISGRKTMTEWNNLFKTY